MSITNVIPNGKGYFFEVDGREHKTNAEGEGLFVKTQNGPSINWQQIAGTCQFSLCGIKDIRGKIRREMLKRG